MMNLDFSTRKDNSFDAIIQARMGSTRLAGKTFADLGGKPLIEHVVDRIRFSNPKKIILAIPDNRSDDRLAEWAEGKGLEYIRGPEDDVLARFIIASGKCEREILIRATGDNPFCEPEIITRTVRALNDESADYAVIEGSPLGTTVEAFTKSTLRKLGKIAKSDEEREHVTLAIWNNPGEFKIKIIDAPDYFRCDGLRLTIDTEKDLEFARHIYRALAGDLRMILLRDIIKYVRTNPLVMRMNGGVKQNLSDFLSTRKTKILEHQPL